MATILKVEEWQSPAGHWYVADTHTWTSWKELADILDAGTTVQEFCNFLKEKYNAHINKVCEYKDKPELIIFNWPKADYRFAHQFKLDVNRIARKKGYEV